MIEIYNLKDEDTNQNLFLAFGVAVSGSFTGVLQFLFRLVFPVFVKNIYPEDVRVGRAVAFFSFAVIGFLTNLILLVTQRLRKISPPVSVVEMTEKCGC